MVVQLDVTVVNVALPKIATELHAGVAVLQWIVDAYALTFAVLLLSAGSLGDRFGSKRLFMFGFALFATASVACGLSPSGGALIAGRAIQGIGAALLVPTSLALLNHAAGHDNAVRARAVGLWTAAGGVSIAAGPLAGGLLLGTLGWRSIFLVNVPLCIIGVWMTLRVPDTVRRRDARRFDPLGQTLAIVALAGLIGAVIEARPLGLTHPLVLAGAALAIVCGAGFVLTERQASSPMVPPEHVRGREARPADRVRHHRESLLLRHHLRHQPLPAAATRLYGHPGRGRISSADGDVHRCESDQRMADGTHGLTRADARGRGGERDWICAALAAERAELVLEHARGIHADPGGMGLAVPAMTTATLAAVEKQWAGTVSALLNTARQAGGAIGVAIFGALMGSAKEHIVGGLHVASIMSAGLLLSAALLARMRVNAGTQREPASEMA